MLVHWVGIYGLGHFLQALITLRRGANKTVDQLFGANSKHMFFDEFCSKCLAFFLFFQLFLLKMKISTSALGAQHPIAGWNIQHPIRSPLTCTHWHYMILPLYNATKNIKRGSSSLSIPKLLMIAITMDLSKLSNSHVVIYQWPLGRFSENSFSKSE